MATETSSRGARRGTLVDAARAFGVVSGGPVLLLLVVLASFVWIAVALASGERPPWIALTGASAFAVYLAVYLPWTRGWGATREERRRTLPGDELVPDAGVRMTRAVTIEAPVEAVWPWLAQIGQDRAGFYSYTFLENLAGCRMPDVDDIRPEWQHREVGETVPLHPLSGLRLARFEHGKAYAFEGWCFVLEALPDGHTRLFARSRVKRGLPSIAYAVFMELPHFVMERKMLLGIRERAERTPGRV